MRYNGAERTFAAGHDVVIGRDLRADVRVADPLISRVHLLLRFDQGRWIAIDNGSLNGLYVSNRRVPVVDIHDGQRINIGNPDGPALDFEVGRRQQGSVGRPPPTTAMPVPPIPSGPWPATRRRRPAPNGSRTSRRRSHKRHSSHRRPPGFRPNRPARHSTRRRRAAAALSDRRSTGPAAVGAPAGTADLPPARGESAASGSRASER
ncbi:FHA domain protein [Mycobacterium kansasii]|uniref:FHA domain protein n=1 Tax=Mycobacterium kansasii TaxID=1768 RepID=A0A1V3X420_MYCKA|nr:FHA domain protein [Mycobacterium kansasii]